MGRAAHHHRYLEEGLGSSGETHRGEGGSSVRPSAWEAEEGSQEAHRRLLEGREEGKAFHDRRVLVGLLAHDA